MLLLAITATVSEQVQLQRSYQDADTWDSVFSTGLTAP